VSGIPADLWRLLEYARPADDVLLAKVGLPSKTPRLFIAVDSSGRRHLLVLLDESDEYLRDDRSRGLTVKTQELAINDKPNARYINLTCEDASGHVMLDMVGSEIADRLGRGHERPVEIVSRVLSRWRRFWGQLPRQLLTREQQLGLFTELWFLAYWLIPAIGPHSAVRRWRGPYVARHDFEAPGVSVEVKGTTSKGRVFTIHGIEQLDPPDGGRLLFFGVRLREEAGASTTLPALVRACRELVSHHTDAEASLETGLIAAGYSSSHDDQYESLHWRVVEAVLFDVRNDFPKISVGTFGSAKPAGVEEISYVINLNTFDELIIARTPMDALRVFRT
jgi:hypothetical protein